MICISSHIGDYSTTEIIDWLKYYKSDYYLLNRNIHEYNEILISDNKVQLKSYLNKNSPLNINFSNINSYWYRRGGAIDQKKNELDHVILNKSDVITNIEQEISSIHSFLYYLLYEKSIETSINGQSISNLNRLKVFKFAYNLGLKIPEYIITNKKKHLMDFYKIHKKIVLKPISNVQNINTLNGDYLQYTKLLTNIDLKKIPLQFFPSLIQEYIDKDFEIRTFYLNKTFFSMAIFSQNNEQTKVDFRKYDTKRPNVNVPYKLPKIIENKLKKLFQLFNLDCCSVDLLHTCKDEYFFLEINPVGQFGMVSKPCNYFLEREIAKTLISYESTKTKKK